MGTSPAYLPEPFSLPYPENLNHLWKRKLSSGRVAVGPRAQKPMPMNQRIRKTHGGEHRITTSHALNRRDLLALCEAAKGDETFIV